MSGMKERIILALDTESLDEALALVEELRDYVGAFKVGLELYARTGLELFAEMKKNGASIFFDGKFHDIPNTVAGASAAVSVHKPFMFNVHATGGKKMMKAAVDAAEKISKELKVDRPKVIAVTLLTSLGQDVVNKELNITGSVEENVVRLALLTKEAGLDGVVASAKEVKAIKKACGEEFLTVTPGVRPAWAQANDQTRIVTPGQALADGADYLVIGRPITAAENKVDAAKRILDEIEQAVSC